MKLNRKLNFENVKKSNMRKIGETLTHNFILARLEFINKYRDYLNTRGRCLGNKGIWIIQDLLNDNNNVKVKIEIDLSFREIEKHFNKGEI